MAENGLYVDYPLLNMDGEAWGELPASFDALPGALRWMGA